MILDRTFEVVVPDVGRFVFKRRTYRHEILIEADMVRMLGGNVPSPALITVAKKFSDLSNLVAEGPPGWDVELLDPLDPESDELIDKVWEALHEAENTFREARKARGTVGGTGNGGHDGVRVPSPVPAAAA